MFTSAERRPTELTTLQQSRSYVDSPGLGIFAQIWPDTTIIVAAGRWNSSDVGLATAETR
jgi:hypothetical protein